MSDKRTLRIARAKRKQAAFQKRRAFLHKYNTIPSFYSDITRRQQIQRGVRHNAPIVDALNRQHARQSFLQQMQARRKHIDWIRAQRIKRRNHQMEWNQRQIRERSGPYAYPWRHPEEIRIDAWNQRMASTNPKDLLWKRAQKKRQTLLNRLKGVGGEIWPDIPN